MKTCTPLDQRATAVHCAVLTFSLLQTDFDSSNNNSDLIVIVVPMYQCKLMVNNQITSLEYDL